MAKNQKTTADERYQTLNLFDKKSAAELLAGLQLAVSLTLQDRRKLGIRLEDDEGPERSEKRDSERTSEETRAASVTDKCGVCFVDFDTVEEWRQHLKLDWHLYNVKRKAKGLKPLSEDQFVALEGGDESGVSSVSGSSSEDSEAEDQAGPSVARMVKKRDLVPRKMMEQPVVFFQNAIGNVFMIHRALLQAKEGTEQQEADIVGNASKLAERLNFGVILVSGGHFAAAIYEGNQMVAHKTFHSYTVRAKQGGSQNAADSRSGTSHPKSAGASLRRYNAQTFKQHVEKLMVGWKDHWQKCDRIFFRVPARNQGVLFNNSSNFPFTRDDPRLCVVPISVGRPTLNEVKRVHRALTTIRYYEKPPAFLAEITEAKKNGPPAAARRDDSKENGVSQTPDDTDDSDDSEYDDPESGVRVILEKLDREFLAGYIKKTDGKKPKKAKKKKKTKNAEASAEPPVVEDTNPVPKGPARDFMKHLSRAVKGDDYDTLHNPGLIPDELMDFVREVAAENGLDEDGFKVTINQIVNLPIEDGTTYLLHAAAGRPNATEMIYALLCLGADPAMKDARGRVPYLLATDKANRNSFRKFMADYPERYDWDLARVPSALTDEMEQQQAAKRAERRKAIKEMKKEKERAAKAEAEARREEEEEKRRFMALSEREKRALAAERRILAASRNTGQAPVLARCHRCGLDITGKTPFVAFDLQFCTTDCLRAHRAQAVPGQR